MSKGQFMSRWSLDDLEQIDPELHAALLDQESMLAEHQAAMARGWQAALKRMEDNEIERARQAFPGATVTSVREKASD
jgi:hypothetical protein